MPYHRHVPHAQAVPWPDEPQVEADERSRPVLIRRGVAAPSTVHAAFKLANLGVVLALVVRVDIGGTVRVAELTIHAQETPSTSAITSRSLRSIKLDALAREAVQRLESPVIMREDVAPGAFQLPGDDPDTFWIPGGGRVPGRPRTPREQAGEAARIYTEALDSGSKAPTKAVAAQLGYSRSQVSRMLRTARDLGLLDNTTVPAEATLTVPGSRVKPEPEPSIFRAPNSPWPWEENG